MLSLVIKWIPVYSQTKHEYDFIDKSGKGYTKIPMVIKNNSPLIEIQLDTNKIFVLVDLGGHSELNLDTSIVKKCGYSFSIDSISSKNYKGMTIKKYNFTIPELTVGEFHFLNFKAQCSKQNNKIGYIGLSLLKNFDILLDYKNSNLYLIYNSIPKEFDVNEWKKVSFNYNNFGISSIIYIDGKKYSFFWDTGARFSILKPEFIDKNQTIKMGNFDFYRPQVIFLDSNEYNPFDLLVMNFKFPPFDGIIGNNFFSDKMVVTNQCQK